MNILGLIPSRLSSTRLPEKPLQLIAGKSLVQRVYEQAVGSKFLSELIVATDSEKILAHVQSFGGKAVLTKADHVSGTDRCAEVLVQLGGTKSFDLVINIQGDEPFLNPRIIDSLCAGFKLDTQIITLVKAITSPDELLNPNVVKAVLSKSGKAIYFSRSPIPHFRNLDPSLWTSQHATYYKHIGLYGFRSEVLEKIVTFPTAPLEDVEKLEQLRWLYYGFPIHTIVTDYETIGVDTPEDLEKARSIFSKK